MISVKHTESGIDYVIELQATGEEIDRVDAYDYEEFANGTDQFGNEWDGGIIFSAGDEIDGYVTEMITKKQL